MASVLAAVWFSVLTMGTLGADGQDQLALLEMDPAAADAIASGNASRSTSAVAVRVGPSGLPVPRFVALKKELTNARFGPSFDAPVAYEFHRRGLPLKVIAEDRDDKWRRVEDRDGRRMWIHKVMLAPNRHVIVNEDQTILRAGPDEDAFTRARLAAGVMATLEKCAEGWCRIRADRYRGWVRAGSLWGVDQDDQKVAAAD